MKRSEYLIWLGIVAAAGSAAGALADPKHRGKGAFYGATSAIIAGSVAAGVYHYLTREESVPLYSSSSPLYEEVTAI